MSEVPGLARDVGAYSAADQTRLTVRMLDALISDYRDELEQCEPERIAQLQPAIRQCRALRRVLLGEAHADPRI